MYLTKFPLNKTRRESRALLSSPYRLHAAIAGSFPKEPSSSETERVLWRIDESVNGTSNLFIVSPDIPSLTGLDEQIGWPDLEPQWQTRDYDSFLNSLAEGQTYGFRLVANPVINRKAITNGRGATKRLPHVTVLQQTAWLVGREAYDDTDIELPKHLQDEKESRAARNGFMVLRDSESGPLQLMVSDTKKVQFVQGQKGRRVTLTTARFDGLLKVIDPNLMRHALTHGIGHAKGFGCGLITLAKVEGA